MKSNKNIFLVAGIVILLIGLYFFATNDKSNKWAETNRPKDQEPYGKFALVELLKSYNPSELIFLKEPMEKGLKKKQKNTNYVFLGESFVVDSLSTRHLLDYVKHGNVAFIATNEVPYQFLEAIFPSKCESDSSDYESENDGDVVYDSSVHLNFSHPILKNNKNYKFKYLKQWESHAYYWHYLRKDFICSNKLKISTLGTLNNSLTNFYRINYGKGYLYFHTNPIVFSNFYILSNAGRAYSEKLLSHLLSGQIYWDEYSQWGSNGDSNEPNKSPLKFILEEPALRSAWYLLLVTVLVYILFFAKRKQRVIPVMEENTNTSIEFTETIGRLYFQQHNHKKLGVQKMKLFLGHLRDRYHLPTNIINEAFILKLSLKSEVPINRVESIFQQYKRFEHFNEITDDTLINFYQSIEYFYQNSKK